MNAVITQVRLMFNLDVITDCVVSSNWLYIVVNSMSVVRINLESPSTVENIKIPAKHGPNIGSIYKIFTDSTGSCLLAVTTKLQHFFYSDSSQKQEFNLISKLKNTPTVSAVFHPSRKGDFFLGTRSGSVIEVSVDIKAGEHFFKRDLKYTSQIWKGERNENVNSIIFRDNGREILLTYGHEILKWKTDSVTNMEKFMSQKPTVLFNNPFEQELKELVESPNSSSLAAILSPQNVGVLHKGDSEFTIYETENPKFLMLSNFHLIAVTSDSIRITGLLSRELVQTLPLPDLKQIKGASIDYKSQTFWVFNDEELYEIKLENETTGLWKMLAKQGRFSDAFEVCDSAESKSYVLEQHGYHILETEPDNTVYAAKLLGSSNAPFESLVLRIMDTTKVKNNSEALVTLIKTRLKHTNSKFQQILLTSLLAECGDCVDIHQYAYDAETIQQILRKRGDFQKLIEFSISIKDYRTPLQYYISNSMWSNALELIRQHGSEDKELVYRYSSITLKYCPKETVDSWMRLSDLDATKLLSGLIDYSEVYRGPVNENQALRYLKHTIIKEGNKDEVVFETTLSMMCANNDSNETELLNFLKERSLNHYDNDFALRLTLKFKQYKCAVYLYTLMGLYEEAVILCLQVGGDEMFNMSIEIAEKQASNEKLRKYLLRLISKQAIETKGPKAALQFIHLLGIGDLLAQFPEFESLDELAPEVIRSLEHTKNKLMSINSEIDESLKASEEIQTEIANFKKQSVLVEPGEPCQLCHFPLAVRKFIVFPCQHGFHYDCLQKNSRAHYKNDIQGVEECALCDEDNLKSITTPLTIDF